MTTSVKRRLVPRFAAILLSIIGMLTVSVSTANADNGDNTAACSSGEICYAKDNPTNAYQKHWWYSGEDGGGILFVCGCGGASINVQDNVSAVKNRDTQCSVRVEDYAGSQLINSQTFARQDAWVGMRNDMNDKNDYHRRVGTNCS